MNGTRFKEERLFGEPEAAARDLLRIYQDRLRDGAPHTYTGVTNTDFLRSGGKIAEYAAGRDYGIAQSWFRIDESGTRVFVLV